MEDSRPLATESATRSQPLDPWVRPLALPAIAGHHKIMNTEDEESDDWEYEYSVTDTEIYYLTLDLSTPEFAPKHPPVEPTIGLKRTRWLNPALGKNKTTSRHATTFSAVKTYTLAKPTSGHNEGEGDHDAEGDADGDIEGEGDGHEDGHAEELDEVGGSKKISTESSKSPQEDAPAKPNYVQILDLHSSNPVVSYRGKVFGCTWAQNIGTELLFTPSDSKYDGENHFPRLRNLPGNVDLLASSSARLISQTLQPTPLASTSQFASTSQTQSPSHRTSRTKVDGKIALGPGVSEQRRQRAHFLEKLIAAKDKRRERDYVTVFAKKRNTTGQLRRTWEELRAKERVELTKVIGRKTGGEEEKRKADERLKQMEKEDMEWAGRHSGMNPLGRVRGRPKGGGPLKVPMGSTMWSHRNVKGRSGRQAKGLEMHVQTDCGGPLANKTGTESAEGNGTDVDCRMPDLAEEKSVD